MIVNPRVRATFAARARITAYLRRRGAAGRERSPLRTARLAHLRHWAGTSTSAASSRSRRPASTRSRAAQRRSRSRRTTTPSASTSRCGSRRRGPPLDAERRTSGIPTRAPEGTDAAVAGRNPPHALRSYPSCSRAALHALCTMRRFPALMAAYSPRRPAGPHHISPHLPISPHISTAQELYLKRLVIGGVERVYELSATRRCEQRLFTPTAVNRSVSTSSAASSATRASRRGTTQSSPRSSSTKPTPTTRPTTGPRG